MKRSPAFLAVAAAALLVLWPSIGTGWFGDDAFYANLPSAIATGRVTLLGAAWHSYEAWLSSAGRWHPGLVIETYGAFALLHDRISYKIVLIVASLLALATCMRFLTHLIGFRFAALAALSTVGCFQMRGYHDPFLAYNGIVQSIAIFTFLSLSAFLTFIETGNRKSIAASIALYLAACSVYEIAYLFAPLYVLTAWYRRNLRTAFRFSLPFFAIGFVLIVITSILRLHANVDPGSPYAVRPDAGAYATALFDQIGASLPLSYLLLNPSKIYVPAWHGFGITFNPFVFIIGALCAYVVLPTSTIALDPVVRRKTIAFGALLIALSAIEVPALVKYQHELLPGLGYLPVFVEYFGVGIALAACLANIPFTRNARAFATILFAIVVTLSSGANAKLAEIIATPYLTSRDSFQGALRNGLLRNVPTGASLAIEPAFPWVCKDDACIDDMSTSDTILALSSRSVIVKSPADAEYVATYAPATNDWSLSHKR